jgi:hypothetical protein
LSRLSEWAPVNLENHYISPGIIDLETYVSDKTGGYEVVTEAAIKGGVTLIVEHPNPHYDPCYCTESLYCDVARLEAVSHHDIDTKEPSPLAFGMKTYLFPPSSTVSSLEADPVSLKFQLSHLNRFELPIFLDVSKHNFDKIHDYSPYHFAPIGDRLYHSLKREKICNHLHQLSKKGDSDDPAFQDSYSEDDEDDFYNG